MHDLILKSFLEQQEADAIAIANDSDVLDLRPVGPRPYQRYLVGYTCRGLVRSAGKITECRRFEMGVYFPLHYIRHADVPEVLTWFGPTDVFHPNILFPFICPGRLKPGTTLVDILYQCFEIITYQKLTMNEADALNPDACVWARKNVHRFPVDSGSLKRRRIDLNLDEARTTRGKVQP